MSLLFKSQDHIQRIVQSLKHCIQMSEYHPTRIVNLHYTNVMDWMLSSNLVNPKTGNPGASPQDVIDIDIQFAKLYFTENKVASVPKEISTLVAGSITYIDAKKIYSFLEQTEGRGSAKNMFGIYNSEALKSWWTLLVSWVTNNLHIAHAVNTLVKRLGIDEPNLVRKYQATEKIFRTIDNRLIELQRASLSYDRAYSDERRAWKKLSKEIGYDSNDNRNDDTADLNKLYGEIVSDISAYHFTRTMDYVFAFSKFAAQGSITVRNDYQSVYKCLRALNAIPSASEKTLSSNSHDSDELSGLEGLECYIRNENFSQELLLEVTGLRAFLNQKLITLEAQEESDDPGNQRAQGSAAVDIYTYLKFLDSVIQKLKSLRKILKAQLHSPVESDSSPGEQVQLLRERAVKYRVIFEELKQNRQDVASSLQRMLRLSCSPLKQWLEEELSKLTESTVNIRYG